MDLQLDSHFIVHYVSGTIWYKEMTHEEGAKLQAKLHSEWKWPNDVPTDSGLAEVDADDITSQLMLPKWNFRNLLNFDVPIVYGNGDGDNDGDGDDDNHAALIMDEHYGLLVFLEAVPYEQPDTFICHVFSAARLLMQRGVPGIVHCISSSGVWTTER